MNKILNYIDGLLVEPVSGKSLSNINPAVGTSYSTLPDSDAADVEQAVAAA